jgi:4-amino-4-deoxy-L-arabinose transferase-like glycosyltransferase
MLIAFVALQCCLPLATAVKIGADEGFELSKATLCAHGYKLYAEIWNDQPPLTTSILTSLVPHVSPRILGPRLLSVSLALILLSSFFILVFRLNGVVVAGLATAMLLASPGFIELSSSCMLEVPALAPIIAAFCVLVVLPSAGWHLGEIIAGVLFGLGLQFKLIGIIYLPLALLIIGLERHQRAEAFRRTVSSSSIFVVQN